MDKSINVSTVLAIIGTGAGIIAGGSWWASSIDNTATEIVRRVSASEIQIELFKDRVMRIEERFAVQTEILKRIDDQLEKALRK